MIQEVGDGGRGGAAELVELVAGEGHDRLPAGPDEPRQLGEGAGLLEGLAAQKGQALDVEGNICGDPLRRRHAAAADAPQVGVEAAGVAEGAALDPQRRAGAGALRPGPGDETGDPYELPGHRSRMRPCT